MFERLYSSFLFCGWISVTMCGIVFVGYKQNKKYQKEKKKKRKRLKWGSNSVTPKSGVCSVSKVNTAALPGSLRSSHAAAMPTATAATLIHLFAVCFCNIGPHFNRNQQTAKHPMMPSDWPSYSKTTNQTVIVAVQSWYRYMEEWKDLQALPD